MSAPISMWEEVVGDRVFVYRGERDSSDHSRRVVVAIRSRTPLVQRQVGARIPPAYRQALLSGWDDARSNAGTQALVRRYVAHPANSLYLYGAVGRGKTFVACTIANELLEQGKAVCFQTVSELLLDLRGTFTMEGISEKSVLQPLFDAQFLILDEMGELTGNRDRGASAFSASRILTLLDSRWRAGKPTILTSNLDLENLERWADDARLASRIVGMCGVEGVVEIGGRDLRLAAVSPEAGSV